MVTNTQRQIRNNECYIAASEYSGAEQDFSVYLGVMAGDFIVRGSAHVEYTHSGRFGHEDGRTFEQGPGGPGSVAEAK